jgi:hypothetical protein
MRKLMLDLDTLDVQSFDPMPAARDARGTVQGHVSYDGCTEQTACPSWYNEAGTCQVTDLGTCVPTCGVSCPVTCRGEQSCITCNGVECYEES